MIKKFQQGGPQQGGILAQIQQLPKEQQAQIMQAFAQWAQQKGVDVKQLQQNPQALEQALGQFMQEMQQSARHGAKLNYIKSLKHQCAEDEEVYYYKKGGSVGCGCKKKEDGGPLTNRYNKLKNKVNKSIEDFKKKEGWKKTPQGKVYYQANKNATFDRNRKYDPKNDLESSDDTSSKKPQSKVNHIKCGTKIKKKENGGIVEQFKHRKK